jgi:hydrogenase maturation protease
MDLVLGLGNPFRRDDGAGAEVARRLAGRLPAGARVLTLHGETAEIVEALRGASSAVLIDATAAGGPPGTVRCFDATAGPLPAGLSNVSSHGLGLPAALELLRILGGLPETVLVYGIEGKDFAPGEGLSPEVEAAVGRVVEWIAGHLRICCATAGDDVEPIRADKGA